MALIGKNWADALRNVVCIALRLFLAGMTVEMEGDRDLIRRAPWNRMCLYAAVYNICPDGGIIFEPRIGPYCVQDFNQEQTTKPAGASFFQLV